LPLTPGASYQFDRHFDAARNPVVINVIRRETIPTPMGELKTVLVEMRVRDPKHLWIVRHGPVTVVWRLEAPRGA